MLKKILIGLGILAAVVTIIIVVVFQMTSGIADIANSFFTEIKAGDFDHAYDTYLSEEFKAATSKEVLRDFLNGSTLSDFTDASWPTRSMQNNQGELEGTITTSDGGTVPLSISFVQENENWKILSINLSQAGLSTDGSSPEMPNDNELKQMVSKSIYDLALAINSEDFSGFYNNVAVLWKNQTTPEKLKQSFISFIEQKIDLTGIKDVEPTLNSPPSIDSDGFLSMAGYFPTQPSMVYFQLDYAYEHPNWNLVGTSVEVK